MPCNFPKGTWIDDEGLAHLPMTTNDEQAKYGHGLIDPNEPHAEELSAMLNMKLTPGPLELLTMDEARSAISQPSKEEAVHRVWHMCEDAFRAKIISGELMVVKTAKVVRDMDDAIHTTYFCQECDETFAVRSMPPNFCPGCGAKIIE